MMELGTISEIWRYPVSSLGGEQCEHADLGRTGVEGDRLLSLFDPATGLVAAPEKDPRWRPALFLKSFRCSGATKIGFPDGCQLDIRDPDIAPVLRTHFGFDVLVGRHDVDQKYDPALPLVPNRYERAPLHLITTSSLSELNRTDLTSSVDPRRFRPNLVIETGADHGFMETEWLGATLGIGRIRLKVSELTKRCGMTFIAQPGLEEQPEILRSIVRQNRRTLGVYCDVVRSGLIETGAQAYSLARDTRSADERA